MARSLVAMLLVCLAVSSSDARDICIQLDTGGYAGSQVVLKKARLARRNVNPLSGYLAFYSQSQAAFSTNFPLTGQAIVNPVNQVGLGMTMYSVSVGASSAGSSSSANVSLNLVCTMGPDGTLSVLDLCSGSISGQSVASHVVDCSAAVALQ